MDSVKSIQKRLDEIKYDCNQIWKQFMDKALVNIPYNEALNWYNNQHLIREQYALKRKLRNIKKGNMSPIPDYGEHLTLKEFAECCDCGLFIDSDGIGYYASETEISDIEILPSDICNEDYRKDFTHVVWFNK